MTLARRCNRKQFYLLYLELNKIASTWLSHLNGKQGKVLGQVCDKEAHVSMCLKVGSIVFSDTTFVMDIKEALAAVSSLPPTAWAGVWTLGKVSPGHRDPESRGRDWQHYTLSQRPTLGHQQRRSRVSSRKQLRTRHRSDTINIICGRQWWWTSEIVRLKYCQLYTSDSAIHNDKLIHGCSGKFALS